MDRRIEVEKAYREDQSVLHRIIRKVLGDSPDGEDAIQIATEKILVGKGNYEESRGPMKPYLRTAVFKQAVDEGRRETGRYNNVQQLGIRMVGNALTSVESTVINKIYSDQFREAIAEIESKDQRRILELLYFEGFSITQAAKHLKIPDGTVRSRMDTAKRKLKEKLGKRGIPDEWR